MENLESGTLVRETSEVEEFLDRLARAMTTGETNAVAELWEVPAFVISDDMSLSVGTIDEVEKFFAGAKDEYNKRGIYGTHADILRLEWISDKMVVVDVRWPYIDKQGSQLGEESSTYTLKRDNDGKLRLRVALMRGASEPH